MTDELTTPVPALGSPLRLVETGLPGEFLVRRQDSSDSLAAAVVRTEPEGVFAYPHQAPYTRLGPFRSASEALTACRSTFSNSGDRPGEAGGA